GAAKMYGSDLAVAAKDAYEKYIRNTEYGKALSRIWIIVSCIPFLLEKLPDSKQGFYISLVRSQISEEEIHLLGAEVAFHDETSPLYATWRAISRAG
ncbi:MAG TPA: hypothetical protein VFV64_06570, partial [Permianibacter sp.]|nr:hypothetical protein [Permianibacter sp.]